MKDVCYNEKIGSSQSHPLRTGGGALSEEYFDVLDSQGNPTGQIKLRRAVHRDGDWHRAVDIWIVNQYHEVLLQKRAADKDSWPNRWDISCGGHLVAGEDAITAAINELHEELGLTVAPSELQLLGEWRSSTRPAPDFINNTFRTFYLLRTDREIQDFVIQEAEISDLKYFSVAELKRLVDAKHPDLVPHPHAYAKLFEILAQN